MFSLFKPKNNDEIEQIYQMIVDQSRQEQLYSDYGVPDKPIGRFQMIMLHAAPYFLSFANEGHKVKSQNLFDRIFKDIELSFREIGVGDLAVPKKMKRYMQDFNGIVQAHAAANADHADITRRNVFGDDGKMSKPLQTYIKGLFS
jgi:cytochrome b pre-mRNA-processing protein 3